MNNFNLSVLPRYVGAIGLSALALWIFFIVPSSAIDVRKCEGSLEPIDAAICKGGEAKSKDDAMAAAFFQLFSRLDKSGKERELKDQRKWLAERARTCSHAEDLDKCIAQMSAQRARELMERSIDEGDLVKGDPIMLGNHKMLFRYTKAKDGSQVIVAKEANRTVATFNADNDERNAEAGEIRLRHTFGQTEAIIITIFSGGTLDCGENYILWYDSTDKLRSVDFGMTCSKVSRDGGVHLVDDGFVDEESPTPAEDGKETKWVAASGQLETRALVFAPKAGTTMQNFSPKVEPLTNEEFFNAISAQTGTNKNRFLEALWGDVNEDYAQDEDTDRTIGVGKIQIDGERVYVGGCGQVFNGTVLICGANDFAMAYYDKQTKKFYFAIRSIDFTSGNINAEISTYPKLVEWASKAKASLADWSAKYDKYVQRTTSP